jgi:gliding motility-associated-like protein
MGSGQADDAQPEVTIINTDDIPSINIYVLTVSNGLCSNTDQVNVTIYPNPDFDITSTDDILCFDAPNNTATLSAAGTGAYTYEWVATASILGPTNLASVDIDPTTNEVFEVIASEDFGTVVCTATDNIAIEVSPPIQITNFDAPTEMCALSCINDGNQDITFSVIDAFNNSYTSSIDGNPISDPICYNDPVNHTLLVIDDDNCEAQYNFTIDVRSEEVVMTYTQQPVPFCYNDENGEVPGLNPEANQYILSQGGQVTDIISQSPFLFTGLTVGTYTLTLEVLLAGGQVCSADTTFSLNPDSPEIFIEANPPAILGCANSPIEFNADVSGGAGGFTTYWNSCEEATGCSLGTTIESTNQPFSLVLTQDTLVYFYALDNIGCSSDTIFALGTLSPGVFLLTQNGADTITTCQYECEELTAFASGGAGALSVEWYQLNDIFDLTPTLIANTDTITECFLFDMIYEIRVIDEQCPLASISDTLWVTVNDTPEPIMEADETGSCYPDTIGFSYTYLDPAYTDLSTCVWSLGNGAQINHCGDTSAVYSSPGTFYPSITITSEHGCVGSDTLLSPITIRPYPEVDFTWEPQPVDVLHRDVHFQNLTAGGASFEWNFYNAGESFMANPRWTFPDIETTTPYSICLYATNQYGCIDTLCQDVYVENVLQVFAPNSFTPDGDGLNDVFLPIVNGELNDSYRFWVFNRWGETVFFTEEVGKAWTGGFGDGDYYIQDGYYFWKIEVADIETSKTKTYEGNVFILR